MTKTLSKKPWEQDECVVHPIWNDGYQRYDLSIAEIIEKIKESGYDLTGGGINQSPEIDYEDDSNNYLLEIHSDKGTFISPTISLILSVRLLINNVDVTDKIDMKHFKWIRSSYDTEGDKEWNLRHAAGMKELYITHEDVYRRATFHCAYLTGSDESEFVQNAYNVYMASINNK